MKTKMSSVHNLMLVSILSSIFVVTLLSFPSPAEADYLYNVCPIGAYLSQKSGKFIIKFESSLQIYMKKSSCLYSAGMGKK
ncbi:hypothetical protein PRUPE_4G027600 [Prunus persica]|uniref:Uncharacterized protein n=1 Tax=Prunus persica TaxID=3760 RepID=A0A251PEU0_PRUPE|nr:hypothetical protein PRUPE_4G027600 [Prunus persica]